MAGENETGEDTQESSAAKQGRMGDANELSIQ